MLHEDCTSEPCAHENAPLAVVGARRRVGRGGHLGKNRTLLRPRVFPVPRQPTSTRPNASADTTPPKLWSSRGVGCDRYDLFRVPHTHDSTVLPYVATADLNEL